MSRNFGAQRSNAIITLTKDDYLMYKKKFKRKSITQIYNPIDETIDSDLKYNSASRKILSIGRFSYQKNFENLVEVAKKVLIKNKTWEWHIYGDGADFEKIKRLINKYALDSQLILKGRKNNLYEIYKDYSFIVMTSRYEGLPMILLEGLKSKLPLVSYDIKTGPNEIIIDKENGFLIRKFKTDIMAKRIDELINDEKLRLMMSKKSELLVSKFSINEIIQKWLNLLDNLDKEGKV
jgi:glycosyltransferase involved in cell wall biosynthesis